MPLKAIAFDAYGTLFDVYSVSSLAEELFPGKGAQLATIWRDKQIEYCRYAVTRETFPLTSQTWEEGDVHEQGSTRDST
jgi:FMN phosphatase YigB (HAD superfamily)